MIVFVYVLAGLAAYTIYDHSHDRMIEKSKDKQILMEVEYVSASTSFALDYLVFLGQDELKNLDSPSLVQAVEEGRITPGQVQLDEWLFNMIDAGFMGLKGVALFLSPSQGDPRTLVFAASDPGMIYEWEVPEAFSEAATGDVRYLWVEEGVPELSISGQSLVVVGEVVLNDTGLRAGYLAIKPMADEIAAINEFYNEKKSDGSRNLALMIIISIAAMSLLTFLFVTFLIRRRITRPIDELSAAAHRVMAGDLKVETPVRRGDEFEGLERAFNIMVKGLNNTLTMQGSGVEDGKKAKPHNKGDSRGRHGAAVAAGRVPGRSRTLVYTTCFLAIMFLAWGLAGFLIFDHWQNGLIDESRNKLVEKTSQYFGNASHYVRDTLDPVITQRMEKEGLSDLALDEQFVMIMKKEISDYQHFYDELSRQLVEMGALGMEKALVVLLGDWIPEGAMVVVSDDESLVYNWTVPDYLLRAIDEGSTYLFLENGMPELGLEGEYIVTIEIFDLRGMTQAYIGIKSMHAEIAEMRSFYGAERNNIYIMLITVMAGALITFILLIFLVIRFLIHRNITRPVLELSGAVAEVIEGNLNVDIPVREGEELEELQRAFRDMVEIFRRLVSTVSEYLH